MFVCVCVFVSRWFGATIDLQHINHFCQTQRTDVALAHYKIAVVDTGIDTGGWSCILYASLTTTELYLHYHTNTAATVLLSIQLENLYRTDSEEQGV